MTKDLNKAAMIGRLGTDPEMRHTPSGTPVTNFRLAVSRRARAGEGEQPREETDWFTVVTWQRLAEIVGQHLRKGSRVYVEGRLQTRSWEGQDGQRRYATEIIASDLIMLGETGGGGAAREEAPPPGDEDYPF